MNTPIECEITWPFIWDRSQVWKGDINNSFPKKRKYWCTDFTDCTSTFFHVTQSIVFQSLDSKWFQIVRSAPFLLVSFQRIFSSKSLLTISTSMRFFLQMDLKSKELQYLWHTNSDHNNSKFNLKDICTITKILIL